METIWLSPAGFVTGDPTLQISYPFVSHPGTVVTGTAPGDLKWVSMGLLLPPNAKIEDVIISYEVSSPQSFIGEIRLAEMKTPDHATVLHDDPTPLRSTSPASYTSHVGGLPAEGAVTLELRLKFQNTSDEIRLGAVGVTIQSTAERCVKSIAALKALSAGAVSCLTVLGYYAPGDGGGGSFYWDASATEIDNGGTIIAPASNPPMGRWKRLIDDHLSVKWFGATGDGQLVNDGAINIGTNDQLLTSATGLFTNASVGKYILVSGAGPSGADLETIIASYVSSTQIRLAAHAATTVSHARVLWGTDDGEAVGRAIAALGSANTTAQVNARVLAFPKGLYLTSAQLPTGARANVIVQGEGQAFVEGFKLPTTGIVHTGIASPFVLLSGNYSRGWQFRDLGLMYAKASFTGTVVDVEVPGVRFIEVLFGGLGFTTSPADLYTAENNLVVGPSEELICERCQFMNAKRHVYITGEGNIGPTSFDKCVFYPATQRFIEFSEPGNFTFSLTGSMFDPVNHGQITDYGLIINTNGYFIAGNAFSGDLTLTPMKSYLRLGGTGAVNGNTFRTNYTAIIAEGSVDISGNSFFANLPLQILASQTVVSGNGNSYYGVNSPVMAVDIAPDYSSGIATVDLGPDYIDHTFTTSYNVNLPGASSQWQYVNGKIRGLGEDGSTNGPALNALVSLERLDPVTKTVATSLTLKHRDSGSIIDNAGATGATTVTLPPPSNGLRYTFQIRASESMVIQTDAGSHFILALNSAQTSLTHSAPNELYAEVTLEGLYDVNAGQANRQLAGDLDVVFKLKPIR